MRKALKKGVRTDCVLTIKLLPALRLNAELPPTQKKTNSPSLLWFRSSLQVFPAGTPLQTSLFGPSPCSLSTPVNGAFGLLPRFPRQPLPGIGLWLFSPFACSHRHKLLVPKPGPGFQDIVPTQVGGPMTEISSYSFLGGHQMALSDHLTPTYWGVGMVGRAIL